MKYLLASIKEVASRFASARALSRALSISLLNQALSSGTNFALAIYLVRVMVPEQFGLYAIGFAISLFYAGVGNALFLVQMVVQAPGKQIEDRLPYAARMLTALSAFCLFTAAGLALIVGLAGLWLADAMSYQGLGVATAGASIAFLLKDFFVRHAYTVRREAWALAANCGVAVSLPLFLLFQHLTERNLDAEAALWCYALSNLTGALTGHFLVKLPMTAVRLRLIVEDMREAWAGGQWYLLVTITYTLQTQAHTMLGAALLGPVGVAGINAARLFIALPVAAIPALNQVFLPRLVEGNTSGRVDVVRSGVHVSVLMLFLAGGYIAILTPTLDYLIPAVVGEQYSNLTPTVYAWCVVLLIMAASSGPVLTIHARQEFRLFFVACLAAAVVSVVTGAALIAQVGMAGAPLGLALGELVGLYVMCAPGAARLRRRLSVF